MSSGFGHFFYTKHKVQGNFSEVENEWLDGIVFYRFERTYCIFSQFFFLHIYVANSLTIQLINVLMNSRRNTWEQQTLEFRKALINKVGVRIEFPMKSCKINWLFPMVYNFVCCTYHQFYRHPQPDLQMRRHFAKQKAHIYLLIWGENMFSTSFEMYSECVCECRKCAKILNFGRFISIHCKSLYTWNMCTEQFSSVVVHLKCVHKTQLPKF